MPKSVTLSWNEYQSLLKQAEERTTTPSGHEYIVQLEAKLSQAAFDKEDLTTKIDQLEAYVLELEGDIAEFEEQFRQVKKNEDHETKYQIELARRMALEQELERLRAIKLPRNPFADQQRPHWGAGGSIQVAEPGKYQTYNGTLDEKDRARC